MKQSTFRLNSTTNELLKLICKSDGVTQTFIVNEALDDWFIKYMVRKTRIQDLKKIYEETPKEENDMKNLNVCPECGTNRILSTEKMVVLCPKCLNLEQLDMSENVIAE